MMNSWTSEDIEAILVQLNNQNLPFKKYRFTALGEGLHLLGKGAFSCVYEATGRDKEKSDYAIKVIGFGDKHVDSASFRESVQAQKELGLFEDSVVKIYDSVELRVWIEGEHDVTKVQKLDVEEVDIPEGNYLHLQFVVLEKVSPIFKTNKFTHTLIPHKLAIFDEQEILKLAYDIGRALVRAHSQNLIHRDIKLENIFYTPKGEHYKLGDFGIARTTDNGLASTVAFTKGYGAPEVVGTLEDKYDCTADIYSFGMMLYVLLNEIRFPESKNYHPNIFQYVQGYVAPEPARGSDELCRIVLKMISFDPDDRYQSMEEVLNEFDKLKYGRMLKYQREHKSSSLVLGAAFSLMGAVAWKLSFAPNFAMNLTIWMYVAAVLCVGKGILSAFKKDIKWISAGIFVIGLYLIIATGFTWWKLLLLIFLSIIGNEVTGVFGGMVLLADATHLLIIRYPDLMYRFQEFRWAAVLLLSLAAVLLLRHYILGERDESLTKVYLGQNLYWVVVIIGYIILMVFPVGINGVTRFLQKYDIGFIKPLDERIEAFMSWNPVLIGILGIVFCIVWIGREWLLMFIEKQREQRELDQQYYD